LKRKEKEKNNAQETNNKDYRQNATISNAQNRKQESCGKREPCLEKKTRKISE
jgi:hypothetical protein